MDKTVFIVGGDHVIAKMYENNGYRIVDSLEDAHIIQFTGGHDVTPDLYGHIKHPLTYNSPLRDKVEKEIFDRVRGLDKLKVGICRGSQFLCVMNGGRLFQDVDNHAIGGTHPLYYAEDFGRGDIVYVTSTHHQMQDPYALGMRASIWGYTVRATYRDYGEQQRLKLNAKSKPDVEIVYYSDTASLAFQPHPEYGVKSCEDLFFRCLERAEERRKGVFDDLEDADDEQPEEDGAFADVDEDEDLN